MKQIDINFDNLPKAVGLIMEEVHKLKSIMLDNCDQCPDTDDPINIEDVVKLTGFKKPTIYSYVRNNEIPYSKKGSRLFFFKPEIIEWIKEGKQKTTKEIKGDVDNFLSKTRKNS